MGVLLEPYGIPYRIPMGCVWESYGIYRIPRGFLLESCGMPIGFQWNPMEFVWESYGIHVGL